MQSQMFVFAAFQTNNSAETLFLLNKILEEHFAEEKSPIRFAETERLITLDVEPVTFHVSIFDDENDIEDWNQMAKDFELSTKPNPVTIEEFEIRLTRKNSKSPNLYSDIHYSTARRIFSEMSKLGIDQIYFFF
jgi:hypothetical protein